VKHNFEKHHQKIPLDQNKSILRPFLCVDFSSFYNRFSKNEFFNSLLEGTQADEQAVKSAAAVARLSVKGAAMEITPRRSQSSEQSGRQSGPRLTLSGQSNLHQAGGTSSGLPEPKSGLTEPLPLPR
jgi:hypothetical protein